jgi:hypothetical protein
MTKGVPRLKMEEHLKERREMQKKKTTSSTTTTTDAGRR